MSNRRYMNSLDPVKRENHRVRTTEYQAVWQLLRRTGEKVDFQMAAPDAKRRWLEAAVEALLAKRLQCGKAAGLVDTQHLISRYLESFQKDENPEVTAQRPRHHLKGVSLDDRNIRTRLPERSRAREETVQSVASSDDASNSLPSEATSPSTDASYNGRDADTVDVLQFLTNPSGLQQKATFALADTIQHLQLQVQWLQNLVMDMHWSLAHMGSSLPVVPGPSMQISMNQFTIGPSPDPDPLGLGLGLLSDCGHGDSLDGRGRFPSEAGFPHID